MIQTKGAALMANRGVLWKLRQHLQYEDITELLDLMENQPYSLQCELEEIKTDLTPDDVVEEAHASCVYGWSKETALADLLIGACGDTFADPEPTGCGHVIPLWDEEEEI